MQKKENRLAERKEFLRIAMPAILENLVGVVITSVDTRMIAPLGKGAVSAVSLTTQPKLLFQSIFFALGTATSIFVSQALGKRDRKEANAYFHSVLRICILLSLVTGCVVALLADPIMRLFSRQQETIGLSVSFFRIIMGFIIFQNVSTVLNAALRGIGLTKVTFISSIFMGIGDIVVNYLLIEGHGGFPALGLVGDALGTVAGTVAACAVSIFFLIRHSDFLNLKGLWKLRERRTDIEKQIRDKAGNLVFENLFTRIGFLLSSLIISGLSSDATAVYFVAMILLNYSFAFGDGLQSAVVSLTGQSMGARNVQKVRRFVHEGRLIGMTIAVCLSAIYIFSAEWYYGMYFSDTASILQGSQYSIVAAVLTLLQILRIVNIGGMRGIGEVKIPRKLASVCVLIINPGTSFLMTEVFGLGVWGIWIGSLVTQSVWCLMSFIEWNALTTLIFRNAAGEHTE